MGYLNSWLDWFSGVDLWWLGFISILSFILSLAVAIATLCYLPENYFQDNDKPVSPKPQRSMIFKAALVLLKNILGMVFLVIGIVLLFLPGQGLLMILVGFLLMNFPGKYKLERWLILRPQIMAAANRVRAWFDKKAFKIEQ